MIKHGTWPIDSIDAWNYSNCIMSSFVQAHPWRSWQRPSGWTSWPAFWVFENAQNGRFQPMSYYENIYLLLNSRILHPSNVNSCLLSMKNHEHPLIWGYSLITRQLYMQRRRWVMELYRDEVGPTVGWLCGIPWKMGIPIKWPTVGGENDGKPW